METPEKSDITTNAGNEVADKKLLLEQIDQLKEENDDLESKVKLLRDKIALIEKRAMIDPDIAERFAKARYFVYFGDMPVLQASTPEQVTHLFQHYGEIGKKHLVVYGIPQDIRWTAVLSDSAAP